jgi:hypothetical protein
VDQDASNRSLRRREDVRQLEDALRLEQDLLVQVRQLIAQLPEQNAYRILLERHEQRLEDAIGRIERLGGPSAEEG